MMDMDNVNNKALFVVHDQMNGIDKIYKFDFVNSNWTEVTTNGLPQDYVGNCLKNVGNDECSWQQMLVCTEVKMAG